MNLISEDIASLIAADSSLGLTEGVDLFIGNVPNSVKGFCVVIYDYSGEGPDPWTGVERNNIQVNIIGSKLDYKQAGDVAGALISFLHGQSNFELNGAFYLSIFALRGLNFIGFEENDRPMFGLSFVVSRRNV